MKIAVIAPTAIPSRRANTIQVMKMSQALANLGHTVRLTAPGRPLQGDASISATLRSGEPSSLGESDVDGSLVDKTDAWLWLSHHYGLRAENGAPQARFSIGWLPASARLRRYDYGWKAVRQAQAWGAELLYTRLPQAAAGSSQLGLPSILEIHDLPKGASGPWLLRLFLKGRGARRLVAITHSLVDDLQARYDLPLSVTGAPQPPVNQAFTLIAADGVDLARYRELPGPSEARACLQLPLPERFTAGYTGHFYAGRGIELLVSLAQRLPGFNFLLAGGEPDEVARLAKILEGDKIKNVVLPGFIPNAALPLYQAACEVLLMPYQHQVAASSGGDISRYLSPMKVFEYMAAGRAIISSNLPVLGEVLNLHNAILLSPDDLEGWVGALEMLQAQPQVGQRLAEQALRDVQSYTWEARARRILEGIA